MDELKPTAGHAMAGGYSDANWPGVFKKDEDIFCPQVLSNAMKKSDGEGGGSKEDPGMNAGSSKVGGGDAGSGKDKAEAVGEDTPVGDEPKSSGDKDEGQDKVAAGDTPAGEEKSDSGPGHSGDKGKGEDPGIDAGSPEGGKETPVVEDKGMWGRWLRWRE